MSCAPSVPLTRPQPAPVAVAVPVVPARPSAAPVPLPPIAAASAAADAVAAPASAASAVSPLDARFPAPTVAYRTPAFETGHAASTSNAELQTLLAALAREAGPGVQVRRMPLGSSQAGLPIEAVLFARHRESVLDGLLLGGRPTVLVVAQQHGDEPAGAEALIVVARELAQGSLAALLDRINVVLLPRANPDGAQANRRNSASGIDLNRDHLLLRSPEAQALARLMREFQPLVVMDLHEYAVGTAFVDKFAGVPRHDALLQYATTANLPEFVTKASEEWFRRPVVAALRREGLSVEWYHTTGPDLADRKVAMGGVRPDTLRNVVGLHNAVGLLLETRGADLGRQHYARRVHTHVVAVQAALVSAAEHASELLRVRRFVDADVASVACRGPAVIQAVATPSEYELLLLDPVSGADKRVGVAWDSALQLQVQKTRTRPCGYWLAADQTDAVRHLRALGVTVQRLEEAADLRGEAYTETGRSLLPAGDPATSVADAGGVLRLQVQLLPALLDVAAGSHYVGLDQPLANLVIAALEPDTDASFASHRIVGSVGALARVLERPQVRMTVLP
ncbi:MAG: M14 family metallocarboxypeptidase [Burkholderiaceae bacterium]